LGVWLSLDLSIPWAKPKKNLVFWGLQNIIQARPLKPSVHLCFILLDKVQIDLWKDLNMLHSNVELCGNNFNELSVNALLCSSKIAGKWSLCYTLNFTVKSYLFFFVNYECIAIVFGPDGNIQEPLLRFWRSGCDANLFHSLNIL
jgi:hypothetical protein